VPSPRTAHSAVSTRVGRGLRHEILTECTDGDLRVLETAVTYTRLDGADVTLPVVSVVGLRDHLVTDYRVYVDLAPVYA
jgi:hypothetical protein